MVRRWAWARTAERPEFDITSFLKPGKNLMAVENLRWRDGSYRGSGLLEDERIFAMRTPGLHQWSILISR